MRVDAAIVGNVVTEVLHGRGEKGRDPNGVDPQIGDIGQPGRDPGEIADPITVGVLKGTGIDFLDDCAAPPIGLVAGYLTIQHMCLGSWELS